MPYISEIGQRQEFQNVQGQLSLIILLLRSCLYGLTYALMMFRGQAFDMQVTGNDFFRIQTRNVQGDRAGLP